MTYSPEIFCAACLEVFFYYLVSRITQSFDCWTVTDLGIKLIVLPLSGIKGHSRHYFRLIFETSSDLFWPWIFRKSCQASRVWSHTPTASGALKVTSRWTWSALPWVTSATPCTWAEAAMYSGTPPSSATTVARPMGTTGRQSLSPHLTTRLERSSLGRSVKSGGALTTDPEKHPRICHRHLPPFLPSSRTPSPFPGWMSICLTAVPPPKCSSPVCKRRRRKRKAHMVRMLIFLSSCCYDQHFYMYNVYLFIQPDSPEEMCVKGSLILSVFPPEPHGSVSFPDSANSVVHRNKYLIIPERGTYMSKV